MLLADFDFKLPAELIARFPVERREDSRLLLVNRQSGALDHYYFRDFPKLLEANDFLVVNDSAVIPARLFGQVGAAAIEMLLVHQLSDGSWECLCQPAKKLRPGTVITLAAGLSARVQATLARGKRVLRFNQDPIRILVQGYAPLPPYIKRKQAEAERFRLLDLERYQTIYGKNAGSIAAPTAGLHFSAEILQTVAQDHPLLAITLAVGEATFQKIAANDIAQHVMGSEEVIVPAGTIKGIAALKLAGKKLLAVGTTTVRALEALVQLNFKQEKFSTNLFISPGYRFQLTDKLLTNFHLPKSSLFILVSAFAGLDLMKTAYRIAIQEKYRFYSYGDAMLII